MKVVVCGSRRFPDPLGATAQIVRRIQSLPDDAIVIHGDAAGADRIAGKAAENVGIQVVRVPAKWEEHVPGCSCGNRSWCLQAGLRRNLEMLDMNPDLVIAFWDGFSRGTKHTIEHASGRGISVEVVRLG